MVIILKKITVGFIRPIDPKPNFENTHFEYLENTLSDIIKDCSNEEFEFEPLGLVSTQAGVADITHTIIKNILSMDIAIIIASGLNANVMFELGLRASQKKPFIVVFDNETNLPFDIKTFFAIKYPKNLNAPELKKFEIEFRDRFLGTWNTFVEDDGNTTFISSFSDSTIIEPNINQISLNEAVDKLSNMIDIMSKQYVSLKTDDVFDTLNFDHDIQIPPK